jgi:hypothetical protein
MEQKRSLFGPLLLIAIGALWLLIKSNSISSSNLWALTHVWPFLFIAAGLGLLLRPFWSYTTVLMDVLIVGGLVLVIVYAPNLGWTKPSMISMLGDSDLYIGPGELGSGKVITETREASDFHAVEVDYPAQVFIKQGTTESVEIEAEDNLMPNLKTEVKNGMLTIFYQKTNDKHINPTKMVTVTITVKDLDAVTFSSTGELTIDNLKTHRLDVALNGTGNLELNKITVKNLSVNLSGAGSMTASGTTDSLDVNISGFGDFKGTDLHGTTANINISGAGSAIVWVDDKLDSQISGAGSINYYGSPNVTKHINGLGSVNHSGNK